MNPMWFFLVALAAATPARDDDCSSWKTMAATVFALFPLPVGAYVFTANLVLDATPSNPAADAEGTAHCFLIDTRAEILRIVGSRRRTRPRASRAAR